jgi:glutamate decarboxylase
LTLDGTPTLNLASFVTTYMEEEAEKLMVESFSKNFIDYEEYPVSAGAFALSTDLAYIH